MKPAGVSYSCTIQICRSTMHLLIPDDPLAGVSRKQNPGGAYGCLGSHRETGLILGPPDSAPNSQGLIPPQASGAYTTEETLWRPWSF